MISDYDCVGFGICAVDYLCIVPRYPQLDEKTEAIDFSQQGGGPVPTALVTLSRLGCKTAFIGRIGNDANGKFLLNEFAREGVDTSAIIVDDSMPTNQAFIWIDQTSGKKSIVLNNQHYCAVKRSEIRCDRIRSLKFLLIDGRDTEATFSVIDWAKRQGAQIVLDAGSPRDKMDELLHRVDYPIVSESFCRNYLNIANFEHAIEALLNFGAKAAVVTCGNRGCYGGDRAGIYFQNAFPVKVVDTTGAGDVFHGAFIFGLLQNWQTPEILKFASATAAIKCMRIGGRLGIPNYDMVKKFMDSISNGGE